ncbi:autotransporter domain-containing protein [Pseudomonas sp. J452]|uniref:autotransporter outer membrane beta-barrel domain-containing protein n=1 Tax=Pseudomonas sp. J452 TaxID=2898441 RepID=UPI0021AD95A4|nr:autotransporter domain-containing protein [Pseudomonas sp. J452]UUY09369.1 autotransporter domain-containing protein [Pseudomonas sp. J452]
MPQRNLMSLLTALLLALPAAAEAAKCKGQGNLLFLGKTNNLSRSVWLSGTGSGSFNLQAPSNDVVDAWQRDRRGLHLSLSPVVSQGSGLPHTLVDVSGAPCELDMENQKGGIVFPPIVQLPPKLPPFIKPPSNRPSPPGLMPSRPSLPGGGLMPSRPGMPSLPGGGATPPIGTLPPSGLMPGMPGGVQPPIGGLGPGSLMPSRPSMPSLPGGGATPPIGTLPPSGLTPGMPGGVQPPIGGLGPGTLTPSRPGMPSLPGGGATPPIGTLPPSGLTPGMPGGVQPPIGGLGPGTLMPSRPSMPSLPGGGATPPIGTLPPSGLTPGMPGGVQPPIGGLGPGTLTPSRPGMPNLPGGGATPPIGTLPPSGLTPGMPGGVQPPIGGLGPDTLTPSRPGMPSLPGGGATPPIATLPPSDLTPGMPTLPPDGGQPAPPESLQPPVAGLPGLDGSGADGQVPLTEGRKFQQEPLWNVWADSRYSDIADRRSGLDLDGHSGYVTIGADRRLDNDLVVGLMGIAERNRSKGFDDDWEVRSDGYSAGPYLAYRLTPSLAMDLSLTVGQLDNDNRVLILRERFDTQRYALSTSLSGQYLLGETLLSPKLSLSYTHFRNEEHEMRGEIAGIPLRLEIEEQSYDYGVAEASLQATRTYRSDGGRYWHPYVEVGLSNEFERPNDGRILTGDLTQEKTSPWSGSLRGGVQAQVADNALIDTSIGYLSLGQNGLDIWEGRVFISIGF